jgi:hypothetical protein
MSVERGHVDEHGSKVSNDKGRVQTAGLRITEYHRCMTGNPMGNVKSQDRHIRALISSTTRLPDPRG